MDTTSDRMKNLHRISYIDSRTLFLKKNKTNPLFEFLATDCFQIGCDFSVFYFLLEINFLFQEQ